MGIDGVMSALSSMIGEARVPLTWLKYLGKSSSRDQTMLGGVRTSKMETHRIVPFGLCAVIGSAMTLHSGLLLSQNRAFCAAESMKSFDVFLGGPGMYCAKTPS